MKVSKVRTDTFSDGNRHFTYDDENQLTTVVVTNSTQSGFIYDGKMRRRIRTEALWVNNTWVTNAIVRYVYDGNLVVEERDDRNFTSLTFTRGNDLSGTRQGAGGIGGLLARTDNQQSVARQHACFHADGNGNVTMLTDSLQLTAAKYLYDAFGNCLYAIGPLAEANLYRFSSKELHVASGLVYYLYRYYEPQLQRWVNRDPIDEIGGLNLYGFCYNSPLTFVDSKGHFFGQNIILGALSRLAVYIIQQFNNSRCGALGADCASCCKLTAAALGVTCAAIAVAGGIGAAAMIASIPVIGPILAPFVGIIGGALLAGECGRDVAMGLHQCLQGCPCPAPSNPPPKVPPRPEPGPTYPSNPSGGQNSPPIVIAW